MKIGIIGSGMIGGTLARLFHTAGHEVAISNSRAPESLKDLVQGLGPGVQASTPAEAARFGDIVVAAVPLKEYRKLPAAEMAGKVVVDAMNYYPDRDGQIPDLDSGAATSSEMVAAQLPRSRVVKAFNTIYFKHLGSQGDRSLPETDRRAIFIAGDDPRAKAEVAQIIEGIGFGAVDTGSLQDGGRKQQPGSAIYNKDITVREAHGVLGQD